MVPPMLLRTKLPTSAWSHAIQHAVALIRICPTTYNSYLSEALEVSKEADILHMRILGCAGHASITPPNCTKTT